MRFARQNALLALTLICLAASALGRGGGSDRRRDPMSVGHPGLLPVLESVEDGERIDLGEASGRPRVLIFGSYT